MSSTPATSLPVASVPPTVIVVHPRENRKKCSVEPLRGRPDFEFRTFQPGQREPLPAGEFIRLGLGGPLLTSADSHCGLLVLDATWRWALPMEQLYADVSVRTLPAWVTAYPRVSKVFENPDGGLATIEAIFAALTILQRPTEGLLDHYHWRDDFLRLNSAWLAGENSGPV